MDKPVIFFSHSSVDKSVLIKLKQLFTQKTGNSIDIFLSSDGQSIPLGRNWVHKIQESLNTAKVMLVFLTPSSIKSDWGYFESGFAYSKNIRVIPIGFLGVDLNQLHPPLSLLQGFNINSEDGLNNLIAIVNEEFEHKHELSITNDDYNLIVYQSNTQYANSLGEITRLVDNIQIELTEKVDFDSEQNTTFVTLGNSLKLKVSDCQVDKNSINFYGCTVTRSQSKAPPDIKFNIDPILINENIRTIEDLIRSVRREGIKGLSIRFDLNVLVDRLTDIHKITARLFKTDIKFATDEGFIFRNLKFEIGNFYFFGKDRGSRPEAYILVTTFDECIKLQDIRDLFDILFSKGILFINENYYS